MKILFCIAFVFFGSQIFAQNNSGFQADTTKFSYTVYYLERSMFSNSLSSTMDLIKHFSRDSQVCLEVYITVYEDTIDYSSSRSGKFYFENLIHDSIKPLVHIKYFGGCCPVFDTSRALNNRYEVRIKIYPKK